MTSKATVDEQYKGLDRRSSSERRDHLDRRNLIRFECLGSERRESDSRRDEDLYIKLYP